VGIPRATYLLTCWSMSPKQVWSRCLEVQEPSCFLSVMWHGEALYSLRGSGCQSFDSSWWFFSAKCGSSISAKFLIYEAHVVCFYSLVIVLDLSNFTKPVWISHLRPTSLKTEAHKWGSLVLSCLPVVCLSSYLY
jgi:hypothetical protein